MAGLKFVQVFIALTVCSSAILGDPIQDCLNEVGCDPEYYWAGNGSWRAEAEANIEKYRKTDLHVHVMDATGRAITDAKVRFEMKRAITLWGTAVPVHKLMIDVNTASRFQQITQQNFNTIVFENDHKWPQWQQSQSNTDNTYRVTWTNDAMSWASQRNIRVRGHAMLWGSWRWSPSNIPRDAPGLRAAVAAHIQDIGSRNAGRLMHWDVLNEPYSENDFTNLLGRQEMAVWFRAARSADSGATLYLNDYPNPSDNNFINFDAECLRMILQAGAPLQGFGVQGHVSANAWNIQQYNNMLNTFGNTGVYELSLTEYDTEISNEQTDANFLRDFLTINYAHPKMNAFLVWGFWDTIHWKGRAPFYRADWTEKPALAVWRQRIFSDWWSDVTGTTDANGHYTSRVFQGEYDIHVTHGGKTKVVQTVMNHGQQIQSLSIVFD